MDQVYLFTNSEAYQPVFIQDPSCTFTCTKILDCYCFSSKEFLFKLPIFLVNSVHTYPLLGGLWEWLSMGDLFFSQLRLLTSPQPLDIVFMANDNNHHDNHSKTRKNRISIYQPYRKRQGDNPGHRPHRHPSKQSNHDCQYHPHHPRSKGCQTQETPDSGCHTFTAGFEKKIGWKHMAENRGQTRCPSHPPWIGDPIHCPTAG